jgi:hypothetical protein
MNQLGENIATRIHGSIPGQAYPYEKPGIFCSHSSWRMVFGKSAQHAYIGWIIFAHAVNPTRTRWRALKFMH